MSANGRPVEGDRAPAGEGTTSRDGSSCVYSLPEDRTGWTLIEDEYGRPVYDTDWSRFSYVVSMRWPDTHFHDVRTCECEPCSDAWTRHPDAYAMAY